jgi:NAD+ synthase (glutamine-hydrolysing)
MSTPALTLALAQINCVVGDLRGNAIRILSAARQAADQGADLMLTPELALSGYPPEDLLLRSDFSAACAQELSRLAAQLPLPVIVGHPHAGTPRPWNAASLLENGKVMASYHKRCLANADVLDEVRFFTPGTAPLVVTIRGVRIGILICEDLWQDGPAQDTQALGADLLVTLNASPFYLQKASRRHDRARTQAQATGLPLVYVNLVGGQDELIFDGNSFALNANGDIVHRSPAFVEDISLITFAGKACHSKHQHPAPTPLAEEAYTALTLGVRDYMDKNRFRGALLGLSGGIDSALTLCIAVDAIGPSRVRAIMMPSPYTAQMSLDDSRSLARQLGVRYEEIPISEAMVTVDTLLKPMLSVGQTPSGDTTAENIQARIRGLILMAISNRTGDIVLTTGNKSEMAVGYATLYGDMAGGFAVIKDVYKTLVYTLAQWRNQRDARPVIPENILLRPPSAELKPHQTDQDTLPPYPVLDAIICAYMERNESIQDITAAGHDSGLVAHIVGLIRRNEYKRRQSPPGPRITPRAFGKDWRYPITSLYPEFQSTPVAGDTHHEKN